MIPDQHVIDFPVMPVAVLWLQHMIEQRLHHAFTFSRWHTFHCYTVTGIDEDNLATANRMSQENGVTRGRPLLAFFFGQRRA